MPGQPYPCGRSLTVNGANVPIVSTPLTFFAVQLYSPNGTDLNVIGPGIPGPTSFVIDAFADTNGTALTSHVGALGAIWYEPSWATATVPWVQSNHLCSHSTGLATCLASGTPPSADYTVSATITKYNVGTTSA
jgi:hypothetical protein